MNSLQDVNVMLPSIMEKIVNLNSLIAVTTKFNAQEEDNVMPTLELALVKMAMKDKIVKLKLNIANMINYHVEAKKQEPV